MSEQEFDVLRCPECGVRKLNDDRSWRPSRFDGEKQEWREDYTCKGCGIKFAYNPRHGRMERVET